MDFLVNLIGAILQVGFDLISIAFRIIVAMTAAGMAFLKRRNTFIWGIGTLIFPWTILILMFVPRRYPKFQGELYEEEAFKHKNPVIASIMALSAIIAKADGSISKHEISFIKRFVSRQFNISSEELNEYAEAFEYGKNHPEKYQEFTRVIMQFYTRRDIIIAIAYLLVCIAMQDGNISDNEDILLRKILSELGLSEYEYNSIKQSFTQQNNGYYNHHYNHQETDSREMLIKKYSEVLGVSEQADMSEIKRAYRKLVKQYHPDQQAADSMPDNYRNFAEQKIIEVNEAYEYLKKVKQA